ncbi:hypothetical protein [Bacillus niameyensis]|uniref:hypothetical protein n=1 Tax=Bacillus niameyensis TaxID=1522308 RepID=UPI0007816DC7|nr:hypothetical protein [Bacillus niameyensis]
MSKGKKPKEIHVENLIIHAKNVEIIEEQRDKEHRRNPWDFFWGRPLNVEDEDTSTNEHLEAENVKEE